MPRGMKPLPEDEAKRKDILRSRIQGKRKKVLKSLEKSGLSEERKAAYRLRVEAANERLRAALRKPKVMSKDAWSNRVTRRRKLMLKALEEAVEKGAMTRERADKWTRQIERAVNNEYEKIGVTRKAPRTRRRQSGTTSPRVLKQTRVRNKAVRLTDRVERKVREGRMTPERGERWKGRIQKARKAVGEKFNVRKPRDRKDPLVRRQIERMKMRSRSNDYRKALDRAKAEGVLTAQEHLAETQRMQRAAQEGTLGKASDEFQKFFKGKKKAVSTGMKTVKGVKGLKGGGKLGMLLLGGAALYDHLMGNKTKE